MLELLLVKHHDHPQSRSVMGLGVVDGIALIMMNWLKGMELLGDSSF